MLIGLKKRKQTVQIQLQKSDDKENITVDIIEATNLADQTKKNRTKRQLKQTVQSQLRERNNNVSTALNVIEASNFVDKIKKTEEEDEKQCIELSKSKKKNNQETCREKKTAHSKRYNPSINHMPGTDHKKRVRCKFEGCSLTSSYYCMECDVHLCIKSDSENTQEKNCFLKYHTLPE